MSDMPCQSCLVSPTIHPVHSVQRVSHMQAVPHVHRASAEPLIVTASELPQVLESCRPLTPTSVLTPLGMKTASFLDLSSVPHSSLAISSPHPFRPPQNSAQLPLGTGSLLWPLGRALEWTHKLA